MIREALQWVSEMQAGHLETIERIQYWVQPGKGLAMIRPPATETLDFSSLTGFADYINENPDSVWDPEVHGDDEGGFIQVKGPECVQYLTNLVRPWLFRHVIAQATISRMELKERRLPLSEMLLFIRTHFQPAQGRTDLLNVLSAIVAEDKSQQFVDDGISQQVTVKSGVASLKRMDVPGDVSLTPLGGFPEVMQAPVDFVLRLIKGAQEPTVVLSPMASPAYMFEYMESLRGWLIDNISRRIKVML